MQRLLCVSRLHSDRIVKFDKFQFVKVNKSKDKFVFESNLVICQEENEKDFLRKG
ncbi:TPA: hypothetical protein KOR91_003173 [Clostridioides difficile]|nr:hypothetical protein [Clostridioides difficile]HBF5917806.1 hypothetical protein [Clostridioides difficile]HBG4756625.1 hypothetical protein [Clostridioides difficile]